MEINEFIEETSKIEKFYEKELTSYQREIWYQSLKNIPIFRYRQIIKKIYNDCKFMPKLADIITIQNEMPYGNNTKIEIEKVNCDKCKGEGLIFYKKYITDGDRKLEYDCVARCDCENGNNYAYDGTKINDVLHRSKFYIATASLLGM